MYKGTKRSVGWSLCREKTAARVLLCRTCGESSARQKRLLLHRRNKDDDVIIITPPTAAAVSE